MRELVKDSGIGYKMPDNDEDDDVDSEGNPEKPVKP